MYFIWNLGTRELNLAAFDALNNAAGVVLASGSPELKAVFGTYGLNYPNEFGTQRYAEPTIHPDGRVAMPVPMVPFSQTSQALKNELWSLTTPPSETVSALTADWFPQE